MKDPRYIVSTENQAFRVYYRTRSGILSVSCMRRDESALPLFAHYITPVLPAFWEDVKTGSGNNWLRRPFEVDGRQVGFFSRQGQISSIVYKTYVQNLTQGLREMETQYITVTPVNRLGDKHRYLEQRINNDDSMDE